VTLFQHTFLKFRISAFVALAALVYAMTLHAEPWQWAVGVFGYFVYGCVGIVVGFHRYLSHRSFKMPMWKERIVVTLGHMAGTASAISWVAKHLDHHRFSDTEKDPHTPHNGIWGMLTFGYKSKASARNKMVLRLARDPYYRALHKYYFLLHFGWMAALFAAFGFEGVLFGHLVPVAFVFLGSAASNLLGHTIGKQRYETHDDSTNSMLGAILTWGEGWHNNHHRYPSRPNSGEYWWEIDIAWYVIRLIRERNQHA